MNNFKIGFVATAMATVGVAQAAFFDFELVASSTGGFFTDVTLTNGGVNMDLSRTSGVGFDFIDTVPFQGGSFEFPAGWGERTLDPFSASSVDDYFVADFSSALFYAEMEMGDFGADDDELTIEAYSGLNGTGDLVAIESFSFSGNINTDGGELISVSSSEAFRSILFRGGDSSNPNSVYIDNIYVDTVPEPTTMALLGLGALLAYRKRKSA